MLTTSYNPDNENCKHLYLTALILHSETTMNHHSWLFDKYSPNGNWSPLNDSLKNKAHLVLKRKWAYIFIIVMSCYLHTPITHAHHAASWYSTTKSPPAINNVWSLIAYLMCMIFFMCIYVFNCYVYVIPLVTLSFVANVSVFKNNVK